MISPLFYMDLVHIKRNKFEITQIVHAMIILFCQKLLICEPSFSNILSLKRTFVFSLCKERSHWIHFNNFSHLYHFFSFSLNNSWSIVSQLRIQFSKCYHDLIICKKRYTDTTGICMCVKGYRKKDCHSQSDKI